MVCLPPVLALPAAALGAENIRLGDRSTERKASFDLPLCFAGVFRSVHGPGVASVGVGGELAVHSLPGLELLLGQRLDSSSALGFCWGQRASQGGASPASPQGVCGGACCCSLDGQLMLVGPGNEIARLAVVHDCAQPAGPASTYDWAVAQAAAAAVMAATAARQNAGGGGSGGYPVQQQQWGEQQAAAGGSKGFGRLLDTFKEGATVLSAEVERAGRAAGTYLAAGAGAVAGVVGGQQPGPGQQQPGGPLPSLEELFATPVVPAEADEDIDYFDDRWGWCGRCGWCGRGGGAG